MSTSHDDMRSLALLSVVVPCYNEEAVIREMHDRLVNALAEVSGTDIEIIYVDDGSHDSTLNILREIQGIDQRVKVISFSRNFGQNIALNAGLANTSGGAVVIIDADLQDPPEVILDMLERWQQGANIVYGLRTEREGESWLKKRASDLFIRTLNRATNFDVPIRVGEFLLIDRYVVDILLEMPDYQGSVLRANVAWTGLDYETVPFERQARFAGTTSYTWKRLTAMGTGSVLSLSIIPLRIVTWVGCLLFGLAILGVVSIIIVSIFTSLLVSSWAVFSTAALALCGVQLLFVGLVSEYLGRIYIEVKRRPLYVIQERLGFVPGRDDESPDIAPL